MFDLGRVIDVGIGEGNGGIELGREGMVEGRVVGDMVGGHLADERRIGEDVRRIGHGGGDVEGNREELLSIGCGLTAQRR